MYKSYLLKNGDPMENNKKEYYSYVEELYKEAAGKGVIDITPYEPYEYVEEYKFNKNIGEINSINKETKYFYTPPELPKYKNTMKIRIKYSKKGYHLFPTK